MAHLRPYMEVNKFQFLYNQIDSGSLEDKVGSIWTELLRRYFYHDEFIVTQHARSADSQNKKADFIIQVVSSPNSTEHVVLVEDEGPFMPERDFAWRDAVGQLTNSMIQARNADKRKLGVTTGERLPHSIYGIVSVGKYSRFYVLHPPNDMLQDLPGTHSKTFHVRDDAQDIMKFFTQLVAATIPYVLSSS
ncbi:hypothetical protein C7999DRAFT_33036 [Corynascus novoguineensis]|uniref:Uncharacterized protein n=1 Tax=Corynascus novoguineensis TaxID=1126955 RepID=A0AAN7HP20_9PEZI|nr:hypothetical protein C7999DRAFT_33036 [Corynascus novoguineensis]